uniref:EF-hand domain-containing protein n=1 Tax=Lotharella oceanica TaxID=641309 RepID=A0A7S2X7W4_9EUKA
MTPLLIKTDRMLAEEAAKHGIKLILGGHDHDKYQEEKNGTTIVKSGYDAIEATVSTITFPSEPVKREAKEGDWILSHDVKVEILNVSKVEADSKKYEKILKLVQEGKEKLSALGSVVLIPPNEEGKQLLSSKDPRNKQCTIGRLFCDILKKFFEADAGLITGGKIRNKSDYPKGLTVTDVGSELPFRDNFTYMVTMTAKELEETLAFSWKQKKGSGGFLQYDNGVTFDETKLQLTHVANQPLDREKMDSTEFKVVMPISILNGMDGISPLIPIGQRNKTKDVPLDHLMLMQDVVTKVCVLSQWNSLELSCKDFHAADKNNDKKIQRHEFIEYMQKAHPKVGCGIIDLFWEALDDDNSGTLEMEEFVRKIGNSPSSMIA